MAVITISREMGTGAYHIAEEVARKALLLEAKLGIER